MNRRSHFDSLRGYLVSAMVGLCALLVASCRAEAGGCRTCYKQAAVVNYQAPLLAVAPPVYATVSPQLQAEAVDTAGFRNSPQWAEYQQLIGYRLRAEQELAAYQQPPVAIGRVEDLPPEVQQGLREAGEPPLEAPPAKSPTWQPPAAAPAQPCPPATNASPAATTCTEGAPAAPMASAKAWLEATQPDTAATCLRCHGSETAKGDFHVAEVLHAAKEAKDYRTLLEIAREVSSGRMPPKSDNMPAELRNKLVDEILALPETPQEAPFN